MRVYFENQEQPASWKGLINDPDLDGSFKINKGITGRDLLYKINEMGLGAGTEYLDLISPKYISDLISWDAIGARTTESQCHRELASGLTSCPVGFKNGTSGDLQIAIDAIGSSSMPHNFLSVTKKENSAIFTTIGNEYCHVILRWQIKTNFDKERHKIWFLLNLIKRIYLQE